MLTAEVVVASFHRTVWILNLRDTMKSSFNSAVQAQLCILVCFLDAL